MNNNYIADEFYYTTEKSTLSTSNLYFEHSIMNYILKKNVFTQLTSKLPDYQT